MDTEFPEKSKAELMAEILEATGFDLIRILSVDIHDRLVQESGAMNRGGDPGTLDYSFSGLEKILQLLNSTRNTLVFTRPLTFIRQTAYKKLNPRFKAEVFVPLSDGASQVAGVIYMARRGGDEDFVRTGVYINSMRLLIRILEQELLRKRLQDNLNKTVLLLCEIINAKEPMLMSNLYTVAHWAVRIARQLKLSEADIRKLQLAALMHNLGKIYIDEQLLTKAEFTSEEQELLQKRTVHSYEIALRLGRIYDLEDIPEIILRFQERVDGKGYPGGLAGEEIPLLSRILCVAKALTAMLTGKPTRGAKTRDEIIWDLRANSGTQFDRQVAEAAEALLVKGDEQNDYFAGMGTYATLSVTTGGAEGSAIQLFGPVRRIKDVYVFGPVEKLPPFDPRQVVKCALYLDDGERMLQFEAEIGRLLSDRIILSRVAAQRAEDAFSVLWFMEGVFITSDKRIHRVYINLLGGDYLDFYIFNSESPTSFTSGIVRVSLGGRGDTYLPGVITFRQQMHGKVFYRFKYTSVPEAERQQVFAAMFKKQLEMRAGVLEAGSFRAAPS